jgi:two-component system, NtrC family, response regulator AtoC
VNESSERRRVLVVDDDPHMGDMLQAALRGRGFDVVSRTTGEGAAEQVGSGGFDALVTDLRMRGMDGIELCERVATNFPHVPVIVMTAFGSMDAAVAAIRAGAYDFLSKPLKPEALTMALDRAIRHKRLESEVKVLRERLAAPQVPHQLLGQSAPMRELSILLERIAHSEASVLITGETGTGKELAAQAIHDQGPRSKRPFVAVNCAAMPEALLESELFGHARGAFTDARSSRAGLFQRADGGTLLLDEVGDMPLPLQVKLLRALQERVVRPVGADGETPVDVRVIAATHQDLQRAVEEGRFREDLYYRIDVIHVETPPLRARGNDVLLLAQHFVESFATRAGKGVRGLSSGVARRLVEYDWPGNVRELRNCIERAVALTDHDQLIVEDLPPRLRSYEAPTPPTPNEATGSPEDPDAFLSLADLERRHVQHVLRAVGGNKARAARILGLDRKTLYRRLEQYEGTGA